MLNLFSNRSYSTSPKSKNTIEALWRLQKIVLDSLDFTNVVKQIVDGLLSELGYLNLGYRIIVLTLVDEENNVLKRISLSNTPEAGRALNASPVPFHQIDIPLNAEQNLLIKTLRDQKPHSTHDWRELFVPVLSDEEARNNQVAAGIKTSMTYPVIVKEQSIGVLIFSMVKNESEVSDEEKELIRGFTDIVGLAVQNSRLYSSLSLTKKNLEEANNKLQALDQLKDEFVSLASHELRTPMTAIKSYLWLFLQTNHESLDEKQKLYIQRAYDSTDRLIALVNDMLNVSRIESGRINLLKKSTDLVQLAKDIIYELTPTAQKQQINLILKTDNDNLPHVYADPNKLKEVFINLVGNSLKFTDPNGSITIKIYKENTMIVTQIIDTGKGIEKEDIPKLFQKFGIVGNDYLRKRNSQGTGLGLYISKSIIKLHGGDVWVLSEGKDKGTTFSFSLPIEGTQPESIDSNPQIQESPVEMPQAIENPS